jgi:uncharacterized protein DUF2490
MKSVSNKTPRNFQAAGLAVLIAALTLPVAGQNQSLQSWPEIDAYWKVNSNLRASFFAASTLEDRQGKSAEIGPNIDFFFKPLVKLKTITVFQLDKSKERPLMLRLGYRYMPSTDGRTEHRGMIEATGRAPLMRGALLSDRNRLDLRSIGGEFSWRYRNRLSAERTVAIYGYHFTPYLRVEGFYDSRYQKWSRTAETIGIIFPFRKRYEIEPYYEHQNDTSTPPNRQVKGLGYVLSMYF